MTSQKAIQFKNHGTLTSLIVFPLLKPHSHRNWGRNNYWIVFSGVTSQFWVNLGYFAKQDLIKRSKFRQLWVFLYPQWFCCHCNHTNIKCVVETFNIVSWKYDWVLGQFGLFIWPVTSQNVLHLKNFKFWSHY